MGRIIAISGGSGAGKTTLARRLSILLGAQLIAEDDYYICRTMIAGFDPAKYDFDAPGAKDHALLADHLACARAGEAFDKPLYDFTEHRRLAQTERVAPAPLLILEGLHALSPVLRAQIDLGVFLEAKESLRLARRLARDVATRGRTREDVIAQFARTVAPAHATSVAPQRAQADLVLVSTAQGGEEEARAHAAAIAARLAALET